MGSTRWETIAVLPDTVSAQALLQRLASEGVEARIRADTPLLGAARVCRIVVPAEIVHRAKWVLAQSQFTDEELTRLAMGEGGEGSSEPQP